MTKTKGKRTQTVQKPSKINEGKTAALTSTWQRGGMVSNTIPAPANPHRKDGDKEKK